MLGIEILEKNFLYLKKNFLFTLEESYEKAMILMENPSHSDVGVHLDFFKVLFGWCGPVAYASVYRSGGRFRNDLCEEE